MKIPKTWKLSSLENLAEVRSGVTLSQKEILDGIELPYLRVANVQDGKIDLTEIKNVKVEKDKVERFLLKKGDVLLTEGGDFDKLGRGAVWQGEITPCLHQNHVFAIRTKEGLLPEFFAALTRTHYGRRYFLSCAKRSTNLASINSSQLKRFPVLLPPLAEQKKIAELLSTWDAAISAVDKQLENCRQQKKALMQKLLTGKKRLPGFSGEWKKFSIGELLYEADGSIQWDDERYYKLLSVKRRSEGVVLRETLQGKSILTKKMNEVSSGDFVISKMQVVHGAWGMVPECYDSHHVSDSYIILRQQNSNTLYIPFFDYFCSQKFMYNKALQSSYGVHIEKMTFNLDLFMQEKIYIPSDVNEQKAIYTLLSYHDQKHAKLEKCSSGRKEIPHAATFDRQKASSHLGI